jgi:hypothetical protein
MHIIHIIHTAGNVTNPSIDCQEPIEETRISQLFVNAHPHRLFKLLTIPRLDSPRAMEADVLVDSHLRLLWKKSESDPPNGQTTFSASHCPQILAVQADCGFRTLFGGSQACTPVAIRYL